MVDCGERRKYIYGRIMFLAEQVKSKGSSLVSCLLEGPIGSGKTAMAASIGIESDFPFVKIVSPHSLIGLSESNKCEKIIKVFEDAYKSQLSIIILDGIEGLLDYVHIGPRFSNLILQSLKALLTRLPPKGKGMLVIGTTSEMRFLKSIGICDRFSVTFHVPTLVKTNARKVLESMNVFAEDDVDAAAEALDGISLKKLYEIVEMARQGGNSEEAIFPGNAKIDINHFFHILRDDLPFED